jgi:high-affinity nickel-transport protein
MEPLSMNWLPLCLSVFALGLRHGLDPDHLATIDGLTRFNSTARPELARWCGALFSVGHGCVVILVAVTVGSAAMSDAVPGWARDIGAWVSIGVLVTLGFLNLALVLRTPSDEMVHPTGLRSRLLSRLTRTARPFAIASIGALFAVSFDTLSQAVLFSATAARFGGWVSAAILGGLFTLGMLLVDGVNGAWVAVLLKRADRRARMASRAIGIFVALISFAVAALGAARYFGLRPDGSLDSRGLLVGVLLIVAVALGSVLLGIAHAPTGSVHRGLLARVGPLIRSRVEGRGSRVNVTMTP